jgi:hypothetical protein
LINPSLFLTFCLSVFPFFFTSFVFSVCLFVFLFFNVSFVITLCISRYR